MNEDGYFGESVAAGYDAETTDMSGPGVVGPAVDFLADGGIPVDGDDLSRLEDRDVELRGFLGLAVEPEAGGDLLDCLGPGSLRRLPRPG